MMFPNDTTGSAYVEIARQEKERARKQKKIDRIAQRAEAEQARRKSGYWA